MCLGEEPVSFVVKVLVRSPKRIPSELFCEPSKSRVDHSHGQLFLSKRLDSLTQWEFWQLAVMYAEFVSTVWGLMRCNFDDDDE